MGGHGHGPPYTIPDYRIYKIDHIPELVATQRALAAQGLCDPWLRNEVWRFEPKQWGTEKSRVLMAVSRGFRVGFAAFVLTILGTTMYTNIIPSDHGHEHGHKGGKH